MLRCQGRRESQHIRVRNNNFRGHGSKHRSRIHHRVTSKYVMENVFHVFSAPYFPFSPIIPMVRLYDSLENFGLFSYTPTAICIKPNTTNYHCHKFQHNNTFRIFMSLWFLSYYVRTPTPLLMLNSACQHIKSSLARE